MGKNTNGINSNSSGLTNGRNGKRRDRFAASRHSKTYRSRVKNGITLVTIETDADTASIVRDYPDALVLDTNKIKEIRAAESRKWLLKTIKHALSNPTRGRVHYWIHADGSCTVDWGDGDKFELSAEEWAQRNRELKEVVCTAFSQWMKR